LPSRSWAASPTWPSTWTSATLHGWDGECPLHASHIPARMVIAVLQASPVPALARMVMTVLQQHLCTAMSRIALRITTGLYSTNHVLHPAPQHFCCIAPSSTTAPITYCTSYYSTIHLLHPVLQHQSCIAPSATAPLMYCTPYCSTNHVLHQVG
jgi:hypothetical protein